MNSDDIIVESHGLLIEDNVAFDIVRHCYFLEDGSEMGNVLNRNLGSRVLPMVPPLLYVQYLYSKI
jgi:cell migration-inducing and hyaluronan-binding protein